MPYGDTFTPRGAAADIKLRGPLWVGIFSFVTFGIYAIYWIYVTAKHLRDYGNARGQDLGQKPGMTLLAITLGWLLFLIPPLVAMFRQAKRIQQAQRIAGVEPMNGWLALVLYLVVSPVYFAYGQTELNKVWLAEGAPLPVPEGAGALPAAPQQPIAAATTTTSEVPVSPERSGA
jgi:hypothetical protein